MVFSSIVFLWVLLPVILACYYITPSLKIRNGLLVLFSLFFYAWGEPRYIVLMLFSVCLNYVFGILIEGQEAPGVRKLLMGACAAANLLLLGYFKYFSFLAGVINQLAGGRLSRLAEIQVVLPIGISFYTFQALSYVIDVYRGENRAQRNLLSMTLYISFFPQLIAGPIVKYHDIEEQIMSRKVTAESFSYGVKRFILGLGKKVILANTFAQVVDTVYGYQPVDVSSVLLWLAAFLYMLQIYFDFSGYSDMAIGLGRMFGFRFQENFNLPYLSASVREFWRRWHISLSSWFREYVYIPLGGNRKGTARTYVNLGIVFLLTGIWHGAGWTFLLWGVYHGFFIILERVYLGKRMGRGKWKLWEHIYTLLAVYFGWILFRAESLTQAAQYLYYMFAPHDSAVTAGQFLDGKLCLLMAVGIGGSGILQRLLARVGRSAASDGEVSLPAMAGYLALMWISIMLLVNNTYNPFIYFRF